MSTDPRIDKHEQLLEKIIEQQVRSEELIKVLSARIDKHDAEIVDLKKYDVDVGKLLVGLSLRLSIGQWILVTAGGTAMVGLVTYLVGLATKVR